MTSRTALLIASYLIGSVGSPSGAAAQGQPPAETVAPNIPGVVAGGTHVLLIKDGFQATEGPVALPDGSLIFTEREANRITKIDTAGNVSAYMENTAGANSLAIDSTGRLIAVQWTKPQVVVLTPTPRVLADQFDGQPFMRPNDLTVDRKGGVYFSDSGVNPPPGQSMPGKLALYYVTPAGKVLRVSDNVPRPNGVTLSRDETILYAANVSGNALIAFDVQPNGTLTNQRSFGTLQVPPGKDGAPNTAAGTDGLAVDADGRVYAATAVGVQVLSPTGERLGTIPIPKPPQNLAFAGADKKTLYVVGRGSAYKIQMLASGFKGRAK
jgi:gluconolactonase